MPFEFKRLAIPEVVLITPKVFGDDRGFFMETYKASEFETFGLPTDFNQDNHSKSKANVLRGLHYQLDPYAQGKFVRVTSGKIFDVAVDIRKGSPTFGRWVGVELSSENKQMLWVPQGFAHGVLVLADETNMLYKCVGEYAPNYERSLRWDDPNIGIEWPFDTRPLLSEKDAAAPLLKAAEINSIY